MRRYHINKDTNGDWFVIPLETEEEFNEWINSNDYKECDHLFKSW